MNDHFHQVKPHYSSFHKLDPRIKFMSYILGLIGIFLQAGFIPYFLMILGVAVIAIWARIPKKLFPRIIKTAFLLFIFLVIFNLFKIELSAGESPTGESSTAVTSEHHKWYEKEIFQWKFLAFSWARVIKALYYTLRVILVILMTLILINTTEPKALTFAIEKLLLPLRLIRVPTHIFAMIISLTIRLVPTLIEEANNIIVAQSSRGLDFYHSNIRQKFKVLVALIIPLIASAFKRAEDMAIAMESRGYNPYRKRTSFQHFYFLKINYLFMGLILGLFILLTLYSANPQIFSQLLHWFNPEISVDDYWFFDDVVLGEHTH